MLFRDWVRCEAMIVFDKCCDQGSLNGVLGEKVTLRGVGVGGEWEETEKEIKGNFHDKFHSEEETW